MKLKNYYEVDGCDIVSNAVVYDLSDSIRASKFPMATDLNKPTDEITKRTVSLGSSKKGEGHDQFLTSIRVNFDLKFSNKAWVELERYRFIEFCSSQSTMHRITRFDIKSQCNEYVTDDIIELLNKYVNEYNDDPTPEKYLKVLYNIPSGFQLTARLTTNYRALKTVVSQRSNHRLPEWRKFCKWVHTLPYFDELTGGISNE